MSLSQDYSDLSKALPSLSDKDAATLLYEWSIWSRPAQRAPTGDWRTWLILAGRGFGKTRSGAEFIRAEVEAGRASRAAFVAPTAGDARDVMVEGESGILAVSPPWNKPLYEPSKRRLTWPNGAIATMYSAEEPERLRGPQHDLAWGDEPASWEYVDETYDMLQFGLRLGKNPREVITGTPKPIKLIRDLIKSEDCVVTRGSTYENKANLAPAFFDKIRKKYEGTRLGRQELYAEILDDLPGALWQWAMFGDDSFRLETAPPLRRIAIAVDPAASSGEEADETGIIAAGLGVDGRGYILADASMRGTPNEWANTVKGLYESLRADTVIAERNNGGEMVTAVLRTAAPNLPVKTVWASRGKRTRAEPVSALYEQRKIVHVGNLSDLETQMTSFVPDVRDGPDDRVDALVYALSELMLEPETIRRTQSFSFQTF